MITLTRRSIISILILILLPCSLFAAMQIVSADYSSSVIWEKKNYGSLGSQYGTVLMRFVVSNSSSGNNSLKLHCATNTNNSGEPQLLFGPPDNPSAYRAYGGYYLFRNGEMMFDFQNSSGSVVSLEMKGFSIAQFEVVYIAKRFEWNVPSPPPFYSNTVYTFGSVPKIVLAEGKPGNAGSPGEIGTPTFPALPFPGDMNTSDSKVPVFGGGDTSSSGDDVTIGGGGDEVPNQWMIELDQTSKDVLFSDLRQARVIPVSQIVARRISGSSPQALDVSIILNPSQFRFANETNSYSIPYDLLCTITSDTTVVRYDANATRVEIPWAGLNPSHVHTSGLAIQYTNDTYLLDLLPSGEYSSTVTIEFKTGI